MQQGLDSVSGLGRFPAVLGVRLFRKFSKVKEFFVLFARFLADKFNVSIGLE